VGVPVASTRAEGWPRGVRLKRRVDFLRVQNSVNRFRGRLLSVRWVTCVDPSGPRFGLTVSRKVGNAVVRNRVKRRLREILRRHRDLWPSPATEVVLIAYPTSADTTFEQLDAEVARALRFVSGRLGR
jgi:ribonuclease P protein component